MRSRQFEVSSRPGQLAHRAQWRPKLLHVDYLSVPFDDLRVTLAP